MVVISEPQHVDLAALITAGATALVAIAAFVSAGVAFLSVRTQAGATAAQIKAATDAAALQSRANVVSASRQRWIDALRDDIAEFITVDSQFKGFDWLPSPKPEINLASVREGDRIGARQMLLLRRINLRLNPEEDEHNVLLEKLWALLGASKADSGEAAEEIIWLTRKLLKREWDRVKREASGDVDVSTPAFS